MSYSLSSKRVQSCLLPLVAHLLGLGLVLPWSDYTNAGELIEANGQNLRYCHPAKTWYVWDGKRWLMRPQR